MMHREGCLNRQESQSDPQQSALLQNRRSFQHIAPMFGRNTFKNLSTSFHHLIDFDLFQTAHSFGDANFQETPFARHAAPQDHVSFSVWVPMAGPILSAHNDYAGCGPGRCEMHGTRIVTNKHRAPRKRCCRLSWRQLSSRVSPFAPNSDQSISQFTILRTAKDNRINVVLPNQSASQLGKSLFKPNLRRPLTTGSESHNSGRPQSWRLPS